MDYRRLGRTGLKVSEICLGTMTFGHGTEAVEAERMVQTALDAGVTFFDTADGYSNGAAETMLGRILGSRRREAVIATKVFNAMGPGSNDSGMSRVHIMNAVEDSLRRLGTDHIDVYYIHHVDVQTPLEEMLRAFDDLVRSGKIRYAACSNYEAWRLMEALWISDSKGLARFEIYQPQYSLVVRDIEEELAPACAAVGGDRAGRPDLAGPARSGRGRDGDGSVMRLVHRLHPVVVVGAFDLQERDMGEEMPGNRPVPMHQARRHLDDIARTQNAGRLAADLHHPGAEGRHQHLPGLVRVPVGAGAWREGHQGRAGTRRASRRGVGILQHGAREILTGCCFGRSARRQADEDIIHGASPFGGRIKHGRPWDMAAQARRLSHAV